MITVRRSEAADFDAWFALFEQVAGEGRWIGTELPITRDAMRPSFDRTLHSADGATFLAFDGEQLVGMIGVNPMNRGVLEFGMMVADGHRGAGIGSQLLQACIEWARSVQAHKVALSVWPHNDAAIGLYKKFGFEVEGRLVKHYRRRNGELWDALLMGLIL